MLPKQGIIIILILGREAGNVFEFSPVLATRTSAENNTNGIFYAYFKQIFFISLVILSRTFWNNCLICAKPMQHFRRLVSGHIYSVIGADSRVSYARNFSPYFRLVTNKILIRTNGIHTMESRKSRCQTSAFKATKLAQNSPPLPPKVKQI